MRWLGRLGCIGTVLLLLAWLLSSVGVNSLDDITPDQSGANTSNAFPVLAYALSKDAPIEFPLHGAGTAVRLLSNAVLDDGSSTDESIRHGYTLKLEFVDRQGKVIDSQHYAHQTKMEWVKGGSADSELRSVTVLEDSKSPVTGSRVIRLPLTERDGARALRVSLEAKDDTIDGVLARFYQHEAVLQHQLDRLWHRLKLHARKRLAQASVYAQSRSLLTDAEKRNLMRNRWRPGGPQDNRAKPTRLFVWRDASQTQIGDSTMLPRGELPALDRVLISDGRPQEWQVQTDAGTSAGKVTLHYDWVGEHRWQTASASVITDAEGRAMIQLPPGFVTVHPDPGHNLRTYVTIDGEKIEQPAQVQRVRSYLLDAQNPTLRYAISHIPGVKTPFRLDLRRPVNSAIPADPTTVTTTVTVTLKDRSGNSIPYVDSHPSNPSRCAYGDSHDTERCADTVTVSIRVPGVASQLDRRVTLDGFGAISERIQRFLALPAEVAWVEVQTQDEALVSGYTRPEDLPHRVQVVPDDELSTLQSLASDVRTPVWFSLLPSDADVLQASGHRQWLHLQRRPPQANVALMADVARRFETLKPEGFAIAREVVIDRTPGQPWQESAGSSSFRPLAIARPTTLDFKPTTGRNRVAPTLLYRQSPERPERPREGVPDSSEQAPFRLTLRRDGEVWFDQWLTGYSGQVRLPSVLPGVARIQANSPANTQLHINMTGVSDTIADRNRRLVYQIGSDSVDFMLHRTSQDDETITIRWFSDSDSTQPVRLRAQVSGAARSALADAWTLLEREFVIPAGHVGEGYLLGRESRPVGSGQVFYIGIGKDIAPGDYRIRLSLLSESTGYVALSRLSSGEPPARTYLVEKDVND